MHWYKRAYRKGSSAAASNIAILYSERGSFRLAVAWYKRAAELGDGDAQLSLAHHYAIGLGVRRSLAATSRHASRALRSGLDTLRRLAVRKQRQFWADPMRPNPSLQPTRYGWPRQPPRAGELKR
jgi:TPR repeat protein